MKAGSFFQLLFLPVAVIVAAYYGGWVSYIIPVTCLLLRPLLAFINTGKNGKASVLPAPYSAATYQKIALLFVPAITGATLFALLRISESTSVFSLIGISLSAGFMNGIVGFTLAHEFIHRKKITEQLAGHILLLQNNYLHYSIEHIGGHHVYACTPKDPHTARRNESFYRFIPRAILYTFINAVEIENRRLRKKKLRWLSFRNKILLFLAIHFATWTIIILIGGLYAFAFFALQSMVAITLLHVTNYLQHYGLMRTAITAMQYERISAHHAWNSPKRENGFTLFQLENHADHHLHPGRSYEQLEHHDESPEQPTGYSGMIILALVPPLWFKIMNKRLETFNAKNHLV